MRSSGHWYLICPRFTFWWFTLASSVVFLFALAKTRFEFRPFLMSNVRVNYFNSTLKSNSATCYLESTILLNQTKNDINGSMKSIWLDTIYGLKHCKSTCTWHRLWLNTTYHFSYFFLIWLGLLTAVCCLNGSTFLVAFDMAKCQRKIWMRPKRPR